MKAHQILPHVVTTLGAIVGAPPVVLHDLSPVAINTIEGHLRTSGAVVVVSPLIESMPQSTASNRFAERVHVVVSTRTNPAVFPTTYQLQDEIAMALLGSASRVEHGWNGKFRELIEEDVGALTHSLHFSFFVAT